MSDLSLFNFNGHDVRVVMIDGAPWWVAADVCRALGMDTSKGTVHRHLGAIAEDEKRMVPRSNVSSSDVSFPNRGAFCVSESGLYKLIMRSDKPEARDFQNWVTRVVLPAIRKDGAYIMGEEKVATGEVSAEDVAERVISALGKKGLLGDVADRLAALERRATIEDFRPAFTAHELREGGFAPAHMSNGEIGKALTEFCIRSRGRFRFASTDFGNVYPLAAAAARWKKAA